MKKFLFIILATMMIALSACQGAQTSTQLTVKDAWARSALQGNPTAIYFVINNPTDEEDVLLTASTDASMMNELTATGGVILLGLAISSLLEIKKIRVGNMLPGLLVAPVIVWVLSLF